MCLASPSPAVHVWLPCREVQREALDSVARALRASLAACLGTILGGMASISSYLIGLLFTRSLIAHLAMLAASLAASPLACVPLQLFDLLIGTLVGFLLDALRLCSLASLPCASWTRAPSTRSTLAREKRVRATWNAPA